MTILIEDTPGFITRYDTTTDRIIIDVKSSTIWNPEGTLFYRNSEGLIATLVFNRGLWLEKDYLQKFEETNRQVLKMEYDEDYANSYTGLTAYGVHVRLEFGNIAVYMPGVIGTGLSGVYVTLGMLASHCSVFPHTYIDLHKGDLLLRLHVDFKKLIEACTQCREKLKSTSKYF